MKQLRTEKRRLVAKVTNIFGSEEKDMNIQLTTPCGIELLMSGCCPAYRFISQGSLVGHKRGRANGVQ